MRGPAAFGWLPGINRALHAARLDLLHLHGIWQHASWAAGRWAAATGRPLVISPHGMLDPWMTGRNAWKKHLARAGWERRSWRRAAAMHALTDAEAADIARETPGAQIVVVPNAAPPLAEPLDHSPPRDPVLLYLGRIHPKKNVAALIAAFREARPALPPGARLVIAGWGAAEDMAAMTASIAGDPAIGFAGRVDGAAKARLLAEARFVCLPSLSEGLPMVVLEAWAHGTPTIMTQACHLPEGFAAGAALPCGTEANAIAAALTEAFGLPETQWQAMAAAARSLAAGPFSASSVGQRWQDIYAGLLERSA